MSETGPMYGKEPKITVLKPGLPEGSATSDGLNPQHPTVPATEFERAGFPIETINKRKVRLVKRNYKFINQNSKRNS